jgi:hypothetical protein
VAELVQVKNALTGPIVPAPTGVLS